MGMLDGLVLDQLCEKVLEPDRHRTVVGALMSRTASSQERLLADLKMLRQNKRKADDRIEALYEAVEERRLELTPSLNKRQSKNEQEREQLIRLVAMKERQLNQPIKLISDHKLDEFSQAMRTRLVSGNPAFRKAYLQLFIDRVDVGESEIRISGSNEALMASATSHSSTASMVPSFVQEWRARRDSNSRPPDS